jgi:two-component system NtrC family sensor kinase
VLIADTGVGISAEHLPHIFQPFFTTKAQGTGLGLAIAARIVERHGGRIEAESEPGHGTTFLITLPVAAAETAGRLPDGLEAARR